MAWSKGNSGFLPLHRPPSHFEQSDQIGLLPVKPVGSERELVGFRVLLDQGIGEGDMVCTARGQEVVR